jgi:hypothetical protein
LSYLFGGSAFWCSHSWVPPQRRPASQPGVHGLGGVDKEMASAKLTQQEASAAPAGAARELLYDFLMHNLLMFWIYFQVCFFILVELA